MGLGYLIKRQNVAGCEKNRKSIQVADQRFAYYNHGCTDDTNVHICVNINYSVRKIL